MDVAVCYFATPVFIGVTVDWGTEGVADEGTD